MKGDPHVPRTFLMRSLRNEETVEEGKGKRKEPRFATSSCFLLGRLAFSLPSFPWENKQIFVQLWVKKEAIKEMEKITFPIK